MRGAETSAMGACTVALRLEGKSVKKRPIAAVAMFAAAILFTAILSGCAMQEPASDADTPELLANLVANEWRFSPTAIGLPAEEASYTDHGGEMPGFLEHAYAGGALRIRTDVADRTVIAVFADVSQPAYAEFRSVTACESYGAYHLDDATVVCRTAPLDEATFNALKAGGLTEETLIATLGQPSFRWHAHGVGYTGMTYVPQGLAFYIEDGWQLLNTLSDEDFDPGTGLVYAVDYPQMREDRLSAFAQGFAYDVLTTEEALANGIPSPDGRYTVAALDGGVYWDQWLVVKEKDKSERRFSTPYFVSDLHWLDSRTVIYGVGPIGLEIYAVDIETGETREVALIDDDVKEFGVSDGSRVWYTTFDGVSHELSVPTK